MNAPPLDPRNDNTPLVGSSAIGSGVGSGGIGRGQAASEWVRVASAREILIVDDNDRHLDILEAILTSVGHEVETCGSGAEALRRLESRHFDVVILDLVMPEISGVTVAHHMRDLRLNRDTPIVVCTANRAIARRELADVAGIAAIVGKPIDTASLVLAVARAPIRQRVRIVEDDQPKF